MTDRTPNDTVLRGTRDQYRLLTQIGRGGMGIVYRAQRLSDGSVWALKEMRPPPDTPAAEVAENRVLFVQEATMLQRLRHPNLVQVIDQFEHEGRPWMVMEFVPGQTLEHRLRETNAPLLEQQVVGWGIQLCRVMTYLHTLDPKVIYRDLKPPNIMLTPDGVLKLIDFGVARTYKENKSKDTVAMGSAGYAPPEQYGKGQTDERSDIYALGATLLHLLTGLPPVPLQTPQPGSISVMNPSVDTQTEQVIIKAMALSPKDRFQSAAEMEQALHRCLDVPYVDLVARAVPLADQPAVVVTPSDLTVEAPVPPPPPLGGTPCPSCGRVNKPGARFCAGCGTPLKGLPVARLQITSPRGTWEHRVERVPCRIGRRDPSRNHFPQIDLAEHDRGIASRNHAQIDRNGDSYTIMDLASTNGTMVNGLPLQPQRPQVLRHGDRIKIGEVELEFRFA